MRWEVVPTTSLSSLKQRLEATSGRRSTNSPRSVGAAVSRALRQALEAMQEGSNVLLDDRTLLAEVRSRGHAVGSIEELRRVPLSVLDRLSFAAAANGRAVAALEGAGTGLVGSLLTIPDIAALLTINLRFISQIAHTYGFRTDTPSERAYVLDVLGVASASGKLREALLVSLHQVAWNLAVRGSAEQLGQRVVPSVAHRVALAVGARLSRRKIAQLVPIAGALVGGSMNYAYTEDNLEAARMVYRRRWLIERYGRDAGRRPERARSRS